jgi:hypothetical protein
VKGELSPLKLRVTLIARRTTWRALRMHALERNVSASRVVDWLVEAYLDESSGIRKAVERWRTRREDRHGSDV